MSKGSKIIIGICIPLLIICIAACVIAAANKPLIFPNSRLTYNLFIAENNEYVRNESLSEKFKLLSVPYTFDALDVTYAPNGASLIFALEPSLGRYVYATECLDLDSSIMNEFPKAVIFDYDKELSQIGDIKTDSGYINGFEANYFIKQLQITNGSNSATMYLLGYELTLPGTQRKFVISASTFTNVTSEELASLEELVVRSLYTLQYDEELAKEFVPALVDDSISNNTVSDNNTVDLDFNGNTFDEEDNYEEDITLPTDTSKKIDVILDKTLSNAYLVAMWNSSSNVGDIKFYDSTGVVFYSPDEKQNGIACFSLGYFESGNYILEFSGDSIGQVDYMIGEKEEIISRLNGNTITQENIFRNNEENDDTNSHADELQEEEEE